MRISRLLAVTAALPCITVSGLAQKTGTDSLLQRLTNTPAVTGYESALTERLRQELIGQQIQNLKVDSIGNLTVSFGSGSPHRLIVAPIDEPGYVVSQIQPDGYLRVQRLPQTGLPPHYNELQGAQPMVLTARGGKSVSGIVAALSIHLEPGRSSVPDLDDLDNMYIDLGAASAAAVQAAGVDVLSPMAAERHLMAVGRTEWTGTAVGDRFGAAALLQLAHALATAPPQHGTVTIAFAVQQWSAARGLTRLVQQLHPEELIYLGRARPGAAQATQKQDAAPALALGNGVWINSVGAGADALRAELEHVAPGLHPAPTSPLFPRGAGAVTLPERTVQLGIPLLMPLTSGETLDDRDLQALTQLLAKYLGVSVLPAPVRDMQAIAYAALPPRPVTVPSNESVLQTLTTSYGVSGAEAMTREAVAHLLPAWAHPTTDASGNLILKLGVDSSGPGRAEPGIVFMAHTDELGFRVRAILPDGTLDLENKGGGSPAFYWGHPAVVHTSAGMRGGVVMLPPNYDTKEFRFPADFRVSAVLHVGAGSVQEVAALGIQVGDTVTIPKRFSTLQDRHVSIRSLDDRVGCAALIRAVWDLGQNPGRNVTFVWSTREELGLQGAAEYAAAADKTGQTPAFVFAIDTFVSSDTPIESHRFADAAVGKGFVVRAIDNSNIVPWKDVQQVQALAAKHKIPMQYGITGGNNDGSTFLRYGAVDVALSWPLRYAHSPGELIDLRDLDSLAAITTVLAREW